MEEVSYFDNIFQMNRKTSKEKYDNMEKQLDDFISYTKLQNLSPIEQIMLVYDKAKLLESAGNNDSLETRQLSDVMANGKAVCAGYTNFFNECVARLGYKCAAIESYVGNTSHMHSIVEINDDKYDIHGIYNFDPTFDSLDVNSNDRSISYAFFGRSVEEINNLKEQREPRGVSIAIMKAMDGKYNEISNEIPTRTMNIVNGFFPSEKSRNFIQDHLSELKDKSNWQSLNEDYLFQISQLGFKVRNSQNISMDTLEQIITNVRKVEQPNLNDEQMNTKLDKIKQFNNEQFSKFYNDQRLMFKVVPKNYVNKEDYPQLLEKINELYSSSALSKDTMKTIIEFTNGQKQQAFLRIESLSEKEQKELFNCTFDSNYDFMSKFLNPLVNSYAATFPYRSSKIGKPEYFNLNVRSFECNSINGTSLAIIDGNLDYLQQLDKYIKENSKKVEEELYQTIPETSTRISSSTTSFFEPSKNDSVESLMNDNSPLPNLNNNSDDDIVSYMNEASMENSNQSTNLNVSELMDQAVQDDMIKKYNEYRSKILGIITNQDSETCIHSDFTIDSSDGKKCRHTLEKISQDSREILLQQDFLCDDFFRTGMLEPSIVDYAKTNPIVSGNVEQISGDIAKYSAFSETNNVLTINNITREYGEYIDDAVQKIDPVLFQQQMEQYLQAQMESSYQKSIGKNSGGFLNVLLLSAIVGFFVGFIVFAVYLIMRMKGMC